jgi:hypothetical protein
MQMVRRRFLVTAAAASACAPRRGPLTLEEVIARHTDARGGAAALDAVQTLRNEAAVAEATFNVRGPYIASTEGLMRVDIFADDQCVFSEGIDREGAWSWSPGSEPQPASEAGAAALRHGVEFNVFGLHRFAERGHALSLEGVQEVAGVELHVVKIVMNDGFETYRFIDPATWMIVRSRDVRAFHPDLDATEAPLESAFSDFREVAGVRSPFEWMQRDLRTGEVIQRGTVLSLEYNTPLTDADFSRTRRA